MNNQPIYLDVPEAIKKELEKTIPFIHQEGEKDFALIQITESGIVHVIERVSSLELARKKVNQFIAKLKKSHPEGTNQTG